jgi:hypothetical protein
MTAFAFILGVVPLMKASGAGAGAQNVMGTGVFWGMLIATALGVFIIPGNFTFIEGLGRRRRLEAATAAPGEPQPATLQVDTGNGDLAAQPAAKGAVVDGSHAAPATAKAGGQH